MQRFLDEANVQLTKQVGLRPRAAVEELTFTGVPWPGLNQPPGWGSDFTSLARLSLVSLRPPLRDVSFLTVFASTLRRLDLSDNRIEALPNHSGGFAFPGLVRLLLANNRIARADAIVPALRQCPKLEILELFMNPIAEQPTYRKDIFDAMGSVPSSTLGALSSLHVIDDHTKDGKEVDVAEDSDDSSDDDSSDDDDDEQGVASSSDDDSDRSSSGSAAGGGSTGNGAAAAEDGAPPRRGRESAPRDGDASGGEGDERPSTKRRTEGGAP
mgnify:CR=1 FL=1